MRATRNEFEYGMPLRRKQTGSMRQCNQRPKAARDRNQRNARIDGQRIQDSGRQVVPLEAEGWRGESYCWERDAAFTGNLIA
jgi:hypothetical protein